MKKLTNIFILVLFILVGLLSWNKFFQFSKQQDTVDIHEFPKTIGDWTSKELTITEREYEILETRNAFSRIYTNSGGDSVMILIVYSQTNRKVSHPPDLCYTGGGFTIIEKKLADFEVPTKNLTIRPFKLKLQQGKLTQDAYYWFKVGDQFTSNYWKQQFLIAVKSLVGQPASSALIRLSTTEDGGEEDQADKTVQAFIEEILPLLHQYLP